MTALHDSTTWQQLDRINLLDIPKKGTVWLAHHTQSYERETITAIPRSLFKWVQHRGKSFEKTPVNWFNQNVLVVVRSDNDAVEIASLKLVELWQTSKAFRQNMRIKAAQNTISEWRLTVDRSLTPAFQLALRAGRGQLIQLSGVTAEDLASALQYLQIEAPHAERLLLGRFKLDELHNHMPQSTLCERVRPAIEFACRYQLEGLNEQIMQQVKPLLKQSLLRDRLDLLTLLSRLGACRLGYLRDRLANQPPLASEQAQLQWLKAKYTLLKSEQGWRALGRKFAEGASPCQQDHKSALECFERAIRICPTAEAWTGAGLCYQKLDQRNEAVRCFRSGIQLDSNSPSVFQLAQCYYEGDNTLTRDLSKAVEFMRQAKKIEQLRSPAHYFMGQAYFKGDQTLERDPEKAVHHFLKVGGRRYYRRARRALGKAKVEVDVDRLWQQLHVSQISDS